MSIQFCGNVMVELTNILGSVDSSLLVRESQSFGKFLLSPSSGESEKKRVGRLYKTSTCLQTKVVFHQIKSEVIPLGRRH